MVPSEQTQLIILVVSLILLTVFYALPLIIIFWKLVKKAGRPGWTQIIPFYNYYVMGDIAKRKWLGIVTIVLSIFSTVLGENTPLAVVILLNSLSIIAGIALTVVFAMQYTSKVGKWIVYLFFPFVGVFLTKKTEYRSGVTKQVN